MSGRGMNDEEEIGFEKEFDEFMEDKSAHPLFTERDLRLWKHIFRRGFYQGLEQSGVTSNNMVKEADVKKYGRAAYETGCLRIAALEMGYAKGTREEAFEKFHDNYFGGKTK